MIFKKIIELYERLDFITFIRVAVLEVVVRAVFPHVKYFFSQEGEDVKILYLLQKYKDGFYIDIGSNDPISNSNTFKLYLMGWHGILVDGNSDLINKARISRKKDICINAIVSNEVKKINFFLAENHLMSSTNKEFVIHSSSSGYVPKQIQMETVSVTELIEKYAPKGQHIDVLSIDVEGHDFEVLQSLALDKYQPTLIVIEDLKHWKTNDQDNIFNKYLLPYGYTLVSKDHFNLYFLKS